MPNRDKLLEALGGGKDDKVGSGTPTAMPRLNLLEWLTNYPGVEAATEGAMSAGETILKGLQAGAVSPDEVVSPGRLEPVLRGENPDPSLQPDGRIEGPYNPLVNAPGLVGEGAKDEVIEWKARRAVDEAQLKGYLTVSSGFDEKEGLGWALGNDPKTGNLVRVWAEPDPAHDPLTSIYGPPIQSPDPLDQLVVESADPLDLVYGPSTLGPGASSSLFVSDGPGSSHASGPLFPAGPDLPPGYVNETPIGPEPFKPAPAVEPLEERIQKLPAAVIARANLMKQNGLNDRDVGKFIGLNLEQQQRDAERVAQFWDKPQAEGVTYEDLGLPADFSWDDITERPTVKEVISAGRLQELIEGKAPTTVVFDKETQARIKELDARVAEQSALLARQSGDGDAAGPGILDDADLLEAASLLLAKEANTREHLRKMARDKIAPQSFLGLFDLPEGVKDAYASVVAPAVRGASKFVEAGTLGFVAPDDWMYEGDRTRKAFGTAGGETGQKILEFTGAAGSALGMLVPFAAAGKAVGGIGKLAAGIKGVDTAFKVAQTPMTFMLYDSAAKVAENIKQGKSITDQLGEAAVHGAKNGVMMMGLSLANRMALSGVPAGRVKQVIENTAAVTEFMALEDPSVFEHPATALGTILAFGAHAAMTPRANNPVVKYLMEPSKMDFLWRNPTAENVHEIAGTLSPTLRNLAGRRMEADGVTAPEALKLEYDRAIKGQEADSLVERMVSKTVVRELTGQRGAIDAVALANMVIDLPGQIIRGGFKIGDVAARAVGRGLATARHPFDPEARSQMIDGWKRWSWTARGRAGVDYAEIMREGSAKARMAGRIQNNQTVRAISELSKAERIALYNAWNKAVVDGKLNSYGLDISDAAFASYAEGGKILEKLPGVMRRSMTPEPAEGADLPSDFMNVKRLDVPDYAVRALEAMRSIDTPDTMPKGTQEKILKGHALATQLYMQRMFGLRPTMNAAQRDLFNQIVTDPNMTSRFNMLQKLGNSSNSLSEINEGLARSTVSKEVAGRLESKLSAYEVERQLGARNGVLEGIRDALELGPTDPIPEARLFDAHRNLLRADITKLEASKKIDATEADRRMGLINSGAHRFAINYENGKLVDRPLVLEKASAAQTREYGQLESPVFEGKASRLFFRNDIKTDWESFQSQAPALLRLLGKGINWVRFAKVSASVGGTVRDAIGDSIMALHDVGPLGMIQMARASGVGLNLPMTPGRLPRLRGMPTVRELISLTRDINETDIVAPRELAFKVGTALSPSSKTADWSWRTIDVAREVLNLGTVGAEEFVTSFKKLIGSTAWLNSYETGRRGLLEAWKNIAKKKGTTLEEMFGDRYRTKDGKQHTQEDMSILLTRDWLLGRVAYEQGVLGNTFSEAELQMYEKARLSSNDITSTPDGTLANMVNQRSGFMLKLEQLATGARVGTDKAIDLTTRLRSMPDNFTKASAWIYYMSRGAKGIDGRNLSRPTDAANRVAERYTTYDQIPHLYRTWGRYMGGIGANYFAEATRITTRALKEHPWRVAFTVMFPTLLWELDKQLGFSGYSDEEREEIRKRTGLFTIPIPGKRHIDLTPSVPLADVWNDNIARIFNSDKAPVGFGKSGAADLGSQNIAPVGVGETLGSYLKPFLAPFLEDNIPFGLYEKLLQGEDDFGNKLKDDSVMNRLGEAAKLARPSVYEQGDKIINTFKYDKDKYGNELDKTDIVSRQLGIRVNRLDKSELESERKQLYFQIKGFVSDIKKRRKDDAKADISDLQERINLSRQRMDELDKLLKQYD